MPFVCSSGLPVQVRDEALQITDSVPKSHVNKEYFTQNVEGDVRSRVFRRKDQYQHIFRWHLINNLNRMVN